MPPERTFWFPARRYGWGWGPPTSWQGWAALVVYLALVALDFALFPPRSEWAAFLGYLLVVTALLIMVCWLKGERPRWRWGDDA
jgi:uncharacterized membrane protein YhaH (DUF805 family)